MKRYELVDDESGKYMVEEPQGEYVRYDDIKHLLSARSETGLKPEPGHCLLQVPQQTTEKPSPCAMAGYCIKAEGEPFDMMAELKKALAAREPSAPSAVAQTETPRTLALNIRCGQDGLSWDQSGPKFHALCEQLERELADAKDDCLRLHKDKMDLLDEKLARSSASLPEDDMAVILGKAIAEAAQRAGIYNGEGALDGPTLLLLLNDMAEVLEDRKRLTRELDVAMHGEEGAAKQASLCDLIPLARKLRERASLQSAIERKT